MGLSNNLGKLSNMITSTGSAVGIAQASPAYTLDVTGTGRFTDKITSTIGNNNTVFENTSATTGYLNLVRATSTGSNLSMWIENSAGGNRAVSSLAYAGGLATYTSTALQFGTDNNIRMTISATGNVGIFTNAPDWPLTIASSTTTAALKILGRTDGGSAIVFSNQANTTNFSQIDAGAAYLFISTLTASPIAFYTNNTERMRITSIASGGYTKISNYNAGYVNVNGNYHEINSNRGNDNIVYFAHTHSSSPYGPYIWFVNTSPNNTTNYFLSCSDSTNEKATIYSNGTFGSRTGTYGSIISDIKYKQDITDANSQWNDIKNLRVVNFKYKEDVELEGENALRQIGFIAQEVEMVSPNLVYEAGKKDTEETWKSVKTSIIHLKAVKALQEAMLRIETLESRLDKAGL